MYQSTQLRWVKNVKRSGGTGWAYMEYNVGDDFFLHWPEHFKGNVLKAPIGDLILIFQTVNEAKGTYLTHIVTPLSNEMIVDLSSTHPFKRLVGVVAKADPFRSIPKPLDLDFMQPNRGACCHLSTIKDLRTKTTINEAILQEIFWELFQNKNTLLDAPFNSIFTNTDEDDFFEEGAARERYKLHKYFERNPAAVRLKKEQALRQGKLYCEVCNFNFSNRYPQIGEGFIECHHKTLLSAGIVRKTTTEDLALVCSNCHRMLHKIIDGDNLTIEQLTKIYQKQ